MTRQFMEVLFTIVVVALPLTVVIGAIALLVKGTVSRFGRKDGAAPATPAPPRREADAIT